MYDNTRIIIVSDHGKEDVDAGITDSEIPFLRHRLEQFNPLLLVKDFNAHGRLKTNDDFMSNADVPVMALREIVTNPINPFTGNPLTNKQKENGVIVTTNDMWMAHDHPKNIFKIKDEEWLKVHDNIFNPDNWEITRGE